MRRTVKEAMFLVLLCMGLFALSLCYHGRDMFFCVSSVTMFARFRGTSASPAAPGKRSNDSNRNTVNLAQAKLSTALNNIAYHHVQKYANAIKANAKAKANSVAAAAAATANPTQTNNKTAAAAAAKAAEAAKNEKEAEQVAAAAAAAGAAAANVGTQTNIPVAPAAAALKAEEEAVNAVARNAAALANFNARIVAANNRAKLTQIEVNLQKYANTHGIPLNRSNIRQRLNAVNTKRNTFTGVAPKN